jgi:2-oxo-4-hydroxy-4-carboxy-5-ureidoimidazoline decarboxylase
MELWRRIDAAAPASARELLRTACGSTRWIERMLSRRPLGTRERALAAARDEWLALGPEDWREAFAHHPRIGDVEELRTRSPATAQLSTKEQSAVVGASGQVLTALADGNRAYEHKFGYIFIVCATGRTAGEMLAALRSRLGNDPAIEVRIAAEEQAKITAIRLASG